MESAITNAETLEIEEIYVNTNDCSCEIKQVKLPFYYFHFLFEHFNLFVIYYKIEISTPS